jgi:putative transposase
MSKRNTKRVRMITRQEEKKLRRLLAGEEKLLIHMWEIMEGAGFALDGLIHEVGRAAIEAVLDLSAQKVAGPRHQGRTGGDICWYGSQQGKVRLSDRHLQVQKPRLRKRGTGKGGEVAIPAYEQMQRHSVSQRIIDILMSGVSTRNYKRVLGEMAESVGVSKSSISREFIEASAEALETLAGRRYDNVSLLLLYVDGIVIHDRHVILALGVDEEGKKHVLGVREGATENAEVVKGLLEDLVERGLSTSRNYLFIIDGSKALRKAISQVFGDKHPVQRCRNHKIRNVTDHLPEEQKEQVRSVMKAAYRMEWKQGIQKLNQYASWLQVEYPSAAKSLLEGLEETFTVNRLDLSPSLRRCLGTTNLIDNPCSSIRDRIRLVKRWAHGDMLERWVATACLDAEHRFRKIMGYKDLWQLAAVLTSQSTSSDIDREQKVG